MSGVPVSIVLRSFNEGWALRDTLPALRNQDFGQPELIVIDSGSTDGSVELIRQAAPRHFVQIPPGDYRPGRVLNTGVGLARYNTVIFLNADATPQGAGWLAPLVEALLDPAVAAVFGRQVPRPGCRAVFAADYELCFGARRPAAEEGRFFSLVSSGIRRDIWKRRGFRESLQYSEDEDYARWCREEGHRVVYRQKSVVVHSHNYTPRQAYKRSFGESCALCAMGPVARPRAAFLGWLNDVRRDLAFCVRAGKAREWTRGWPVRWAQRTGRRDGFLAGSSMRAAETPA